MKLILKILLGLVWLVLYILTPLITVISLVSSKFVSVVGGLVLLGGVFAFCIGERDTQMILFIFFIILLGCILIVVSPFIAMIAEGYQNLLDRIGSIVLGKIHRDNILESEEIYEDKDL